MTPKLSNQKPQRIKPAQLVLLTLSILTIGFIQAAQTPALAKDKDPAVVISISGTGHVNAEPDITYISSGVVSEAKTAKKALADNNEKMQAIFEVLAKTGIERKHIQTSNFSVQPRYNHYRPKPGEEHRPPKIVGYTVNNTLTVKVIDLSTLGQTITEVVKFGSNQLGNIRFDVSNKKELLDEARKAAVLDARRKAEIYTSAAGVKIGKLLSLREGSRSTPRPRQYDLARASLKEAAPTPVSGGEQQLSITVAITWEIEQ